MVNNRVKKILTDSNIPFEIKNGSIVFKNSTDDNIIEGVNIKESEKEFEILQNNSIHPQVSKGKLNEAVSDIFDDNMNRLQNFYNMYLNSYNNDVKEYHNTHEILSFDEFNEISIPSSIKFKNTQKIKLSDQSLIECTSELLPNVVHLNFNILTDYFKYAHSYSPIIQPTVLIYRIKNRTLSPGLLLAIYALTFLFSPNQNKLLADFYFDKAEQYLTCNISSSDIQNVHTAYLLSNYCPGTNKSYIYSGLAMRLLKVLKLYDNLNLPLNIMFYEERIKTVWCCIGKDFLLNITSNRLDRPGWLDQPIPQSFTDSLTIKNYTPERLTVVFMAVVVSLTKIIRHARERRNNVFDKGEFKYLIQELALIQDHLEKHISLSQEIIDINSCSQLSCVIYLYILFFTAKLVLFNFELSPYIYSNTLIRSKKYVEMKHKEVEISYILNQINKEDSSINNKSFNELKNKENNNHFDNINNTSNITKNTDNIDLLMNQSQNKNINFKKDDKSSLFENYEYIKMEDEYVGEYCILSKLSPITYNYKLFVKDNNNECTNNKEKAFLKIPQVINNLDYANCFNVCFDIVEQITRMLKIFVKSFNNSQIRYQNSLCWAFYYIGTFYMMIYANFKKEDAKEKIEFYYSQIRVMYKIYPFLSLYYSKLYEEAKLEAYEAFSNNSVVFCQKGPF
ncbi:hypothetical protein BCR36DRAFT_581213 [Piromyces finnis]|uniref:Transcription factor domain-containing protein n=1 Tax=Piromyces finnis TaxID=1754191 RepID=A0A1Y1VH59_9FUNG|nr:hypothetical protein BCR36DRAFT_581213 [Piromyces finnis]|eukprot:ORX56067.1 hypothetical protein BCR36DRAFT_581213 [Piromyces finnis]